MPTLLSRSIVNHLLEDDELDWTPDPRNPDEVDSTRGVDNMLSSTEFDEGVTDLIRDARELYIKARKTGVLSAVKKSARGIIGYDPSYIAQAFVTLALERSGNSAPNRLYKALKRQGHYFL